MSGLPLHAPFAALCAAVLAGGASAQPAPPRGEAPTVVLRALSDAPNAQAVTARFWVPDLDAGFVPQGLAVVEGTLALAGYFSVRKDQDRGPCRLMRIDPASGRVLSRLDLPAACGHAGGVAALSDGRVVAIDTHALTLVAADGATRVARLAPPLTGSFGEADATSLWIGRYDRTAGVLWRLPLAALERDELTEADVIETRAAPARAQGLAIDAQGRLWLSTSGARSGEILRLDAQGGVEARFPAPAGIEDIAFDAQGRLWASSEAGSRRWKDWPTFYPLLFALDPAALRPAPPP